MKKTKKILSLLLMLAMVMSLVACGGNNASNEQPAENQGGRQRVITQKLPLRRKAVRSRYVWLRSLIRSIRL